MTVVVTHSTPSDASFSTTGATAWDANHTLSGVGTMAGQDANTVAITGGSIDSTTVGATTASTGAFTTLSASSTVSGAGFSTYLASPPAIGGTAAAAGTFTTLTATGQTNLGGSSSAPSFRATVGDNAPNTMWIEAKGASTADAAVYLGVGGTSAKPLIIANSANAISFRTTTIGGTANQQLNIAHTASAVNYVQVTGRATGNGPQISAQGSDAAINLEFLSKVNGAIKFFTGTSEQFRVPFTTGTIVNYATATGAIAGAGPIFSVAGTDADIDLNLTPKGAGNVRFGTYTVSALLAVAGYITIKDSGGTTRRLLVG